MRIRSTKPEFWKSRRITSVSWDARLVLKGLESYVDDNGVGVDDIELIVTDVFPRDMFANGSDTVARVSEAITELHQAGLVHRYKGPSDDLLYIAFWEDIQRIDKPGKGRNPRPDGTLEYKESLIRESVASPPEVLAPGTGEQGNRGTEEQGIRGAVLLSDSRESNSDGTLIPDDWSPNQKHSDHARSLGLDLEYEASRFRAHAQRVNRRGKNWNAGFTNWLKKGAELAQQRQASGGARPVGASQRPSAVDKARAYAAEIEEKMQ